MQRRLLVEAQRQVAIAVHLAGVGKEVARAVHRFHAHRLVFRFDEEHVLPIVFPVSRPLPQRLVVDERRLHLDVAGGEEHVAHVVGEQVIERRALVQPERGAWCPLVEREESEIAAELSMVALLGLLDLGQVRLQLLVAEERGTVDALHRLIARIALPVRVRGGQQLERLQAAARRHVRPDAEIDEEVAILDRVDRDDLLSLRLLLDQLHLQRLAALAEEPDRFLARPHLPLVDVIAGRDLLHPLLDGREVLGHERPLDDEVVEEAFVGRGTDPALHVRKELRDRRGEQVRRAVAVHRQRLGIFRRQHPHLGVFLQRVREIDHMVVHHPGVRRLRQARRYRCGDIADSRSLSDRFRRSVWESNSEGQSVDSESRN